MIGMIDPFGRFEGGKNFYLPSHHTSPPFALGKQGIQDYHIVWRLNPWGNNSRESRTENSFEVVTRKPRVQGVDTHGQEGATVVQMLEGLSDVGACRALVRAWDRVLEIQDQCIRTVL